MHFVWQKTLCIIISCHIIFPPVKFITPNFLIIHPGQWSNNKKLIITQKEHPTHQNEFSLFKSVFFFPKCFVSNLHIISGYNPRQLLQVFFLPFKVFCLFHFTFKIWCIWFLYISNSSQCMFDYVSTNNYKTFKQGRNLTSQLLIILPHSFNGLCGII